LTKTKAKSPLGRARPEGISVAMDILSKMSKDGIAPPAKKQKMEAEKGTDPFQTIAQRLQAMRKYILEVVISTLAIATCL
jgi:hypothetical protein